MDAAVGPVYVDGAEKGDALKIKIESIETVIAVIVGFVLILGFVGQLYGFNSAIVALFIGIMLRDFNAYFFTWVNMCNWAIMWRPFKM